MENLTAAIQAELDNHGDRVVDHGLFGWSTRLNKIEMCRAELSVRVTNTNNKDETSVRTETVNFSLGAIEPYEFQLEKNYLELPCARHEKCVSSSATCISTTKGGIVIDCATQSRKRTESLLLEFDGDVAAAARLEQDFRQAVDFCHELEPVTF